MHPKLPKIIFGTTRFAQFEDKEGFLTLLERNGVNDLDTASSYPESEKVLGEVGAPKRFTVHTKAPGFCGGTLKKDSVLAGASKSFKELGISRVETYFLHSPDYDTPVSETLEAIHELYTAGHFKRFGLSNFKPEQVEEIHSICKSKGFVLPTVYQGNYNPVSRAYETTLFPLLRRLDMVFYAYSPIAGGFLVKDAKAIRNKEYNGTRWDTSRPTGRLYNSLYAKPALLECLTQWNSITEDAGIDKGALAYRWFACHSMIDGSKGDAVIIGASSTKQLGETLKWLNDGPLPENVVERVNGIYEIVKHEAPIDNLHG